MNLEQAKKVLMSAGLDIEQAIAAAMEKRRFSYKTFGSEIEPVVSSEVERIFADAGHDNLKRAKDKNEFPDIAISLSDGCLAVDIKTGNHYKKARGAWGPCKNSQNDLGTIREWPKKLDKFGGENIFFLFIEYSITDKLHKVEVVRIAPFYRFLDTNRQGLLKYRKKDGNLRPKNFGGHSPIDSMKKFESLLTITAGERAKSILREHIETIPKKQRNAFLDELKID